MSSALVLFPSLKHLNPSVIFLNCLSSSPSHCVCRPHAIFSTPFTETPELSRHAEQSRILTQDCPRVGLSGCVHVIIHDSHQCSSAIFLYVSACVCLCVHEDKPHMSMNINTETGTSLKCRLQQDFLPDLTDTVKTNKLPHRIGSLLIWNYKVDTVLWDICTQTMKKILLSHEPFLLIFCSLQLPAPLLPS